MKTCPHGGPISDDVDYVCPYCVSESVNKTDPGLRLTEEETKILTEKLIKLLPKENMQKTLGVIVGRFQVPTLHEGHRTLFETVLKENTDVLVILGVSGGQPTDRNPLDIKARECMLHEAYGAFNIMIRHIFDKPSNEVWSYELDSIIEGIANGRKVTLYASTDSFAPYYSGKYPVKELPEVTTVRGKEVRKQLKDVPDINEDFRKGMIYQTQVRYPAVYSTIDIVVYNIKTKMILLGKKKADDGWRLIGGFADSADESLEITARRECFEETHGIEIGWPVYVGSHLVDDFRYRRSLDKIMTAIFIAQYMWGGPKAGDDLDELEWFPIDKVEEALAPHHKPLWKKAEPKIRERM
jgi:bifunctional NMN adenylyltransferase/nudix hydrolase